MVQAPHRLDMSSVAPDASKFAQDLEPADLSLQVPDPEDEQISDYEFQRQVEVAWQVCDRFDLQTDIWRGRILRAVRDREKRGGEGHGTGFINWLRDREISKSQAYSLIELAESADTLLSDGLLEPEDVSQFSKRAFVETAHASSEVQQMVSEAAHRGDRITRREVRQLSDDWTAMTSDLVPTEVKEKAANNTIPTKYLSPFVKEMEKLPEQHQVTLKREISENPELETLKQVTAEAKYLAKYLGAATQVQTITQGSVNLESALEEALRVGCLNATADLVNQAAQVEQSIAKLYTAWKQLTKLSERVYLDSGSSTPNLRSLLTSLDPLSGQVLQLQMGDPESSFFRTIRLQMLGEEE